MTRGEGEETDRAWQAAVAVDQERAEQAHRVAALAVAHGFDVGGVIWMDRRGDRRAPGEVGIDGAGCRAQQGLGVGPGQLTQTSGDARKNSVVAQRCNSVCVPRVPAANTT